VEATIFYDGVCGLCHRLVQLVLRRDRRRRFRFAALQSAIARETLARHGRNPDDLDTVYVVVDHGGPNERVIWRGRAILYILRRLGGAWPLTSAFAILPTFLLDLGYRLVARSRYRLFGKLDQCAVPERADRERFLDI
jgi:predicted DCC family thiol-disulfide oxidoreductase YuxK